MHRHIFVLGAGASVEYGLPTWNDLAIQLNDELSRNLQSAPISLITGRAVEKETIEEALKIIGSTIGNDGKTIDEAVYDYRDRDRRGDVDNLIFTKIALILVEKFRRFCISKPQKQDHNYNPDPRYYCDYYAPNGIKDNPNHLLFNIPPKSWIAILNKKLLGDENYINWSKSFEKISRCFFINYNYDAVLSTMLLSEIYPDIENEGNYRSQATRIFYPSEEPTALDHQKGLKTQNTSQHTNMHNFYKNNLINPFGRINDLVFNCHMKRREFDINNYKTVHGYTVPLFSCHVYHTQKDIDSKMKSMLEIFTGLRKMEEQTYAPKQKISVNILGLGGGLKHNLDIVRRSIPNKVYSNADIEINLTCYNCNEDQKKRQFEIVKNIFIPNDIHVQIKPFDNCSKLIDSLAI